MAQDSGDVGALFGVIVSAITAGRQDLTSQQRDGLMMQTAMQILSGDWTPFDTIRPHVTPYVAGRVAHHGGSIESYANHLATSAAEWLADNGPVNEELAARCKDGANAIGYTYAVLARNLSRVVDAFLNFAPAPGALFSTELRGRVVVLAGEWIDGLTACMAAGPPGVQALFQKMSVVGGAAVTQKYPQHAMAAMMGIPMMLNMITQFHVQYHQLNPNVAAVATPRG